MKPLSIGEDYTRSDVHGIFSPDTTFTPQAGTWGLQGVVAVPGRQGDFVFFVTFGQTQGTHVFDEGITSEGVLTWQSQPSQGLSDARIQAWIRHDELVNDIHLFLRTRAGVPYTYLGRLAYLSHDEEREFPVHFQWQILDWTPDLIEGTGPSGDAPETSNEHFGALPETLVETPAPTGFRSTGVATAIFRTKKSPDWSLKEARDRRLGLAGELLVLNYERARLHALGRADLAQKVTHVAATNGDGAGYDIRSYSEGGKPKYVEVKTTKGGPETPFYISRNEMSFSESCPDSFELYSVHSYTSPEGAKFFRLCGPLSSGLMLEPVSYRARVV